jgi:hypothetical protein
MPDRTPEQLTEGSAMFYRYSLVYFFGWRVKDLLTGCTSERDSLTEEHASRLVLYLNSRA